MVFPTESVNVMFWQVLVELWMAKNENPRRHCLADSVLPSTRPFWVALDVNGSRFTLSQAKGEEEVETSPEVMDLRWGVPLQFFCSHQKMPHPSPT